MVILQKNCSANFMNYKTANTLIGWLLFLISTTVYFICCEPTVSWWDCGEYISTSYKLQVGHPPGAPLFQLIGRFFCLFAGNDTTQIALMMNRMSAVASGFTIMFLFWCITHFARKLTKAIPFQEPTKQQKIIIFFSGIVGALAYTFSDTFWSSAVESEVYALSSLFTAISFWAILKWEEQSHDRKSFRWIILIFYLIGLSIGVHLLNLLTIPALIFVVYFKKHRHTFKGIFITLFISITLLAILLWGIIPYLVIFWSWAELFFSKNLNFAVGTGSLVYFGFLFLLFVGLLYFSSKYKKRILNNCVLCLFFLMVGYSSFALLIIRSNANTPINEGNPDNGFALSAYLGRDQYGKTPFLYGQYYTAPILDYADGKPVYAKQYSVCDTKGKTIVSFFDKNEAENFIKEHSGNKYDLKTSYGQAFDGKGSELVFAKGFSTFFPRMWSPDEYHRFGYETWGGKGGTEVSVEGYAFQKPTFVENLRFFASYQLGYMYFRYFMWNFSGKFNDLQGRGGLQDGQWITGFPFIDKHLTHLYDDMPKSMENKGHNAYYLLPLLLGLVGFLFQFDKNNKENFVLVLLFFFTGIAIVIYLNQPAYQVRERDYAYAASFFAFSIWIGLGVAGLCSLVQRISKKTFVTFFTALLCLGVPALMAQQNWDDHNRSHRTIALDAAKNYLESCEKNAILFTFGDNDTFPLWYAQEVEGIRTDVRVVNFSLLGADWYIDQCKRKVYESEGLPISLSKNAYISQNRETVVVRKTDEIMSLKKALKFVANDDHFILAGEKENKKLFVFPASRLSLKVDTNFAKKLIEPYFYKKLKPSIVVESPNNYLAKNTLIALDIIAQNDWKRPVYFTNASSDITDIFDNYLQNNGFVYQLVPVKVNYKSGDEEDFDSHYPNTGKMYDCLMHKASFGHLADKNIYLDEISRQTALDFRAKFALLSNELLHRNQKILAKNVAEKGLKSIPSKNVEQDFSGFQLALVLLKLGEKDKAEPVFNEILTLSNKKFVYYTKQDPLIQRYFHEEIYQAFMLIQEVFKNCKTLDNLYPKATDIYFANAGKYLDFCLQNIGYYTESETTFEDVSQISQLMETVNYLIQHARENGKQDIENQAENVMKKAIVLYNQLAEDVD